jgi:hypothetical protein
MWTGILDDAANSDIPEMPVLFNRPATVGREAPRIERGSDVLVCVLDIRI